MAHRREGLMVALALKISSYSALPSDVDVAHDREYNVPIAVNKAITVNQGADNVIQRLAKYVDSELEFDIELQARVDTGVRPATLLNALEVIAIKALTPYADGSAGIAGASNMTQVGVTAMELDEDVGERPTAYMTLKMTIQYRRDADNPETFTP